MNKIKLTALPCICADVFYGTEIIRPGGEALNFAAHASHFKDIGQHRTIIQMIIRNRSTFSE